MKMLLCVIMITSWLGANAQSQAAQQLALNVEKLAQIKMMSSKMVAGYNTLSQGYNQVVGIAKGNFTLHQGFLDALLDVSPSVRNYKKIAAIVSNQALLVKEYRSVNSMHRQSGMFTPNEIMDMANRYELIIGQSLQNIDALVMVLSPRKLKMNDAERIAVIDAIDRDVASELEEVRKMNLENNQVLAVRSQRKKDVQALRVLIGIK